MSESEQIHFLVTHLLSLRLADGRPVVHGPGLLAELCEDPPRETFGITVEELAVFLAGSPDDMATGAAATLVLCGRVNFAYRIVVGAVTPPYPVDWLCAPASRDFLSTRWPAYRNGRRL